MLNCISVVSGLETMKLDMGMYQEVIFAQTKSESEYSGEDEAAKPPVCTLRVHSVSPTLDVPKVPKLESMPSFLKRRLARRYKDRGEPVPEYLLDDFDTSIDRVMDEVTKKVELEN